METETPLITQPLTCSLVTREAGIFSSWAPGPPHPAASVMLPVLPSHQRLQPCVPSLTSLGPTLVRSLTSRPSSAFLLRYQIPVDLLIK